MPIGDDKLPEGETFGEAAARGVRAQELTEVPGNSDNQSPCLEGPASPSTTLLLKDSVAVLMPLEESQCSAAHATTAPEVGKPVDEIPTSVQPIDLDDLKESAGAAPSLAQEQHQSKPNVLRSTPEAQTGVYGLRSPSTEEVPRADETALSLLPPETPSPSLSGQTHSLEGLVGDVIGAIVAMSDSQDDIPVGAHATILQSLQASVQPIPKDIEASRSGTIWTASDPTPWSGTMWIGLLKAGEARSKKSITLNIIRYMGAALWFDAQVASGEAPPTKKGKRRLRVQKADLHYYDVLGPLCLVNQF
jgi:hypothetical protein